MRRTPVRTLAWVIFVVAGLVYLYRCGVEPNDRSTQGRRTKSQRRDTWKPEVITGRAVVRVVDGDTIVLDGDETVRLIGVDTPETKSSQLPVQRFGREATDFLRKKLEGAAVRLECGPDRRDVYGRTLAYVYVGDRLINKEIIGRGYGYAMAKYPHPRLEEFVAAERRARAGQRGLWNYSLTDARLTNLAERYERLGPAGKRRLDTAWEKLLAQYPAPNGTE